LDSLPIDGLKAHLRSRFHAPLHRELVKAALKAIELTAAERADILVEIERGPNLAAGTIVEMLDLDRFVDLAPPASSSRARTRQS
jgi:hypothetical protein